MLEKKMFSDKGGLIPECFSLWLPLERLEYYPPT